MDSVRQSILRSRVQNGTATPSEVAELQKQNMVDTANASSMDQIPRAKIAKPTNDTQYMMSNEERSRMNDAYAKHNPSSQGQMSMGDVQRLMQQQAQTANEQDSINEWSQPAEEAPQMGDEDKQRKLKALQMLRGK